MVWADDLLAEVFANLIGNAVKFGGPDVVITISVETLDGSVVVTVADTGPGVPDELKESIFRRFERGLIRARGGVTAGASGSKIGWPATQRRALRSGSRSRRSWHDQRVSAGSGQSESNATCVTGEQ